MGNALIGCIITKQEFHDFCGLTDNNPARAIHWFVQQVITGQIEPEEFRNALIREG